MDVRPEVEDVCQRNVKTARYGDVFFEVYNRMKEHELRAIPIVDDAGKVVGILSLLQLMDLIFRDDSDPLKTRTVATSLQKICEILGGRFQHSLIPTQHDELLVMVGAMIVLEQSSGAIFGKDEKAITSPFGSQPLPLGESVLLLPQTIYLIVAVFAVFGLLFYFYQHTDLGKQMFAVGIDQSAARGIGIDVRREQSSSQVALAH